jgi:broad specificity phosphatase PhoE
MHLLLLRHAESAGNASGDYSTDMHDQLSSAGERQAAALPQHLSGISIDTVLCSPLERALQTAAPLLEATRMTATVWPELAEACWQPRSPTSLSWPSEPMNLPEDIEELFEFRDGKAVRPAATETFGQGLYRVLSARSLIEESFRKTDLCVLAITHGYVISEMLNAILKTSEHVFFPTDNCGVASLRYNDRTWTIDFVNRPSGTLPWKPRKKTAKKAARGKATKRTKR